MADAFEQVLSGWLVKLQEHEQAVARIKKTVNDALAMEGRPPMFDDPEPAASPVNKGLNVARDAFFGKPMATSLRTVLEMRSQAGQGAATLQELYDALMAGGYDFDSRSPESAKKNLAISLGKNMLFIRTPNNLWGLREWYGAGARALKRVPLRPPEENTATLILAAHAGTEEQPKE